MAKILIIDDEENIRRSLKSALERRKHSVVTAEDFKAGEKLSDADFDIIFLDVFLPDGNGIDLLKKMLKTNKDRTVVMISGHADIDTAVRAIQAGAYDFIEKPISLDRVLITLDKATEKSRLTDEKEKLSSIIYGELIGNSKQIKKLKSDIAKSAPKTSRFLILGENGTGKELVAHMIHQNSRHKNGSFVTVNCAAMPKDLVESELFGHTAGAFTGATKSRKGRFLEADGGSIFLDEISEMSPAAQAKILRVIESSEITAVGGDRSMTVDCNIIAASNRDLNKMVAENKFRQDLLYRLNVVQFEIPPLRERKNDIGLLAEYFLRRFANETGGEPKTLSDEAMDILKDFNFPGNVRELKNIMERANIYCEKSVIGASDLSLYLPQGKMAAGPDLKTAAENFEIDYIKSALYKSDGNVTEAARRLGIERSHLYKKMNKYGIR